MYTYHYFIVSSRWLLVVGILWLPVGLLAQSSLESAKGGKRTDTVRIGMGIFGKVMGIHGADTLALSGDLVLVEAHIAGEGILSLCANQPQRIIAQKSSVQKLHIANATKVVVQGDLRIIKSLVIEKGMLDSRMANFSLSDSCRVHVEKEGQLLWPQNQFSIKQAKAILQLRADSSTAWIDTWQELRIWKTGCFHASIRFASQQFRWLRRSLIPLSPPPEADSTSASRDRA